MKKRIWVVGGSIGAVVLLLVLSFHPVIASDVNRQMINEKSKINRSAINLDVLRHYLQKHVSTSPLFDIFKFLELLSFIFGCFLYLFVKFYDAIFGW